jgi:phage-related protein (TIGR01555 family)
MTIKILNNNIAPEHQIKQLESELSSLRLDSLLTNLATKIGSQQYDKRLANRVNAPRRLSRDEIDWLFEGSPYAAKLVEGLPNLCTRKPPIYALNNKGFLSKEQESHITSAMQDLVGESLPYFRTAYSEARKYGGSVIVIGANDNETDLTKPLNVNKLRTLDWLDVRTGGIGGEIQVAHYQDNPTKASYNEPEIYQFTDRNNTLIHRSRLLIFDGIRVGRRRSRDYYYGWSCPILSRAYSALIDYTSSLDAIAVAVQDFNRIVVKIAGLAELLNAKKKKEVEERLQMMNYISSVLNVWLLDPKDEHSILSRNFSGVSEMVELLKNNLGSCSELPHTTFFNQSPDGITSGSSEAAELNQVVATVQNDNIKPGLMYLIKLWHLAKEGVTKGKEPEDWSIRFPSIYEETELERADLNKKRAETNNIYLTHQVIFPDEVAEAIARDIPISAAINLEKREEDRVRAEELLSH